MEEAHAAFEGLKHYLSSPPVIVAPELSEPLLLYIVATTEVVSMVLFIKRQESRANLGGSPVRKMGPRPWAP
jgi:hypothetical protein